MDRVNVVFDRDKVYEKVPKLVAKTECLTPLYKEWINASNFVMLMTIGPETIYGSLLGDDDIFVKIQDHKTLILPDWRGNVRIDSLRNTVTDTGVSLLFVINDIDYIVRVDGNASVTADKTIMSNFARKNILPKAVIVVRIKQVYFQSADTSLQSKLNNEV